MGPAARLPHGVSDYVDGPQVPVHGDTCPVKGAPVGAEEAAAPGGGPPVLAWPGPWQEALPVGATDVWTGRQGVVAGITAVTLNRCCPGQCLTGRPGSQPQQWWPFAGLLLPLPHTEMCPDLSDDPVGGLARAGASAKLRHAGSHVEGEVRVPGWLVPLGRVCVRSSWLAARLGPRRVVSGIVAGYPLQHDCLCLSSVSHGRNLKCTRKSEQYRYPGL